MPFASGGDLALRRAYLAAAMALGFFALGYGAILISRQGQAIAAIWPATAFALCLVLRNARSNADIAWLLAAMFPAGLVANALGGSPLALNIGYSLINILAVWMGVPVDLLAGLGFIAVFAAATNTPLACTFMGVELFGTHFVLYYAVACFTAYYFSGHTGIYGSQRIGIPKTATDSISGLTLKQWSEKTDK